VTGEVLAQDEERRAAIQQLWTDGDYARIGELFEPVSEQVVAGLDLAGRRVLDAATGTGNTAILAAQAGAAVTGFDLTPALLEVARQRASHAGVDVRFVEGDLLAIPFPDASFEVVLSTFGAFLADDQRACALELVRVCRPGGRIVTTAWADDGIFGSMLDVMRRRHPALLEDVPDRQAWVEPEALAGLFEGAGVDIDVAIDTTWFRFPSIPAAMALFEVASGPVQRMRAGVLADGGDWDLLRDELQERWSALARPAGERAIDLPGSYAVATIDRR
jgi:SAM-dependent methyltransferase